MYCPPPGSGWFTDPVWWGSTEAVGPLASGRQAHVCGRWNPSWRGGRTSHVALLATSGMQLIARLHGAGYCGSTMAVDGGNSFAAALVIVAMRLCDVRWYLFFVHFERHKNPLAATTSHISGIEAGADYGYKSIGQPRKALKPHPENQPRPRKYFLRRQIQTWMTAFRRGIF